MKPNQWVRFTAKDSPNHGKVCAVQSGRPVLMHMISTWSDGAGYHLAYREIHPGNTLNGPRYNPNIGTGVRAEYVELLGPEECAALDAEYGLKGSES